MTRPITTPVNEQMNLKEWIRDIPDFPIPGVTFRDISPLLQDSRAFRYAIEKMVDSVDMSRVDHIVGIESRGFILGAALAERFSKGFVALRKAGKLPPPVVSLAYKLEYGEATLEMRAGQGRVLVVDDVLATGGTLQAAILLSERAGYEVTDVSVLINLKFLNDFKFRDRHISAAVHYD